MSTPADWPLWEVFVRVAPRARRTCTSGRLHAPDAEMALRNARDVYTRRRRASRIWVVPVGRRSPRPARTRRTRSSTRPPTRSTGTRRSTTSPRGSSTCDAHLVTSTTSLGLADDALVSAQRMGEWISRAPAARGGRRARPTSASTCSARRARCSPTPARSRATAAARTTSPTCATSASSATCSSSSGRRRRLRRSRWPGCWSSRRYQAELYAALRGSRPTRPWPASPARRSRRSPTTATTPTQWVAAARRRHRRVARAACRPRSTPSGRTSTSCSTPVDPALVAAGIAVDPRRCAPPCSRGSTTVLDEATLTVPEVAPRHRRRSPRACTPRTSATCSPRCSTCTRSHPGATW